MPWKHRITPIPTYGFLELIDHVVPLPNQGSQSEVFFAFDAFGVKLPILCKVVRKNEMDVDMMVNSQNLASSYGIAPKIIEVHEDDTHYRIIMELLTNVISLGKLVQDNGYDEFTSDIKKELVHKIRLLYKLKIDHGDLHGENILLQQTINGKYKVFIIDYDHAKFPITVSPPKQAHYVEFPDRTFVFDQVRVEYYHNKMIEQYERIKNMVGKTMADKLRSHIFFH